GLSEERAAEVIRAAEAWLAGVSESATCRAALSPHAPYSARVSLIADAGKLSREPVPMRPLAIHLAESPAELELLYRRRGPFVAFLTELGVWDPSGLADGFDAVMTACDFRQPKLFV